MDRTKYEIGTKVMTTKGSGELWEGNHPCFYDCDIQVNLNN